MQPIRLLIADAQLLFAEALGTPLASMIRVQACSSSAWPV
jgi:hypothetical protein